MFEKYKKIKTIKKKKVNQHHRLGVQRPASVATRYVGAPIQRLLRRERTDA
jgi:hypothetical protein